MATELGPVRATRRKKKDADEFDFLEPLFSTKRSFKNEITQI